MICCVNQEEQLPLLQEALQWDPVFGSRLATELAAYGLGTGQSFYWLQKDGERVLGAIGFCGGSYLLSEDGQLWGEELAQFLSFMPAAPVGGRGERILPLARRLATTAESSHQMEYRGGELPPPDPMIVSPDNLSAVFSVMVEAYPGFKERNEYSLWLCDMARRRNRGLSYPYLMTQEGIPVCTGMISHQNHRYAVVGSIATLPAFRGRGYASRMTRHLTGEALRLGKQPVLCCQEDRLARFYQKEGYEVSGSWGEMAPRQCEKAT